MSLSKFSKVQLISDYLYICIQIKEKIFYTLTSVSYVLQVAQSAYFQPIVFYSNNVF